LALFRRIGLSCYAGIPESWNIGILGPVGYSHYSTIPLFHYFPGTSHPSQVWLCFAQQPALVVTAHGVRGDGPSALVSSFWRLALFRKISPSGCKSRLPSAGCLCPEIGFVLHNQFSHHVRFLLTCQPGGTAVNLPAAVRRMSLSC